MYISSLLAVSFAALATAGTPFSSGGNLPSNQIILAEPEVHTVHKRASTSSNSTSAVADASCTFGPTSRNCWTPGFSVADDFDEKWPTTGVTRYYTLTVQNSTCNPDGSNKKTCFLFNGQFPGPTINANWGDMISVTVNNNLKLNETGIHWHGIRQLNNTLNDGVGGLTECPLAPGHSTTYTFQATQFGTSWYHSHASAQYGDGLFGPIVIAGPSSANYDIDMGPLTLSDWYYTYTSTQLDIQDFDGANYGGGQPPPNPTNILINGTNMNAAQTTCKYLRAPLTKGKKYLLRLINSSVYSAMTVSLDGHQMQILTADFVPVQPIMVNTLMINIGQRYEVVINANQAPGNYWFRAQVETGCTNDDLNSNGGLAIFTYNGVKVATPTTTGYSDGGCVEPSPLTPWVPNTVGSSAAFIAQSKALDVQILIPGVTTNNQNIITWGVNTSALHVMWNKPIMSYVMEGNNSWPSTENLIELVNEGVWTFWIIQEIDPQLAPVAHPIHLHGHDFYILGSGNGQFDTVNGPATLQYNNPTRRDVVTLPGGGWVVVAFKTDNPGSWLMHCHIAWHASQGLGVQFLEAASEIALPGPAYQQQCNAFDTWYATSQFKEEFSGI